MTTKTQSITKPQLTLSKEMHDDLQKESRLLDMINKVQMFQIAGDKINK